MNTTMQTNKKIRSGAVVALLLSIGLFANDASARILLATSNTVAQGGAAAALLRLNGGGATTLSFTVPTSELVRVIFNAEATIAGPATNWLDDTILIDGLACVPSNSDNALVSGNGTATQNDGWISAATQCYRVLSAGAHTISVQVTPNPAALWRIDDLSLVIDTD